MLIDNILDCVLELNCTSPVVKTLISIGVSPALLMKLINGILSDVLEISLLGTILIFLPMKSFLPYLYKYFEFHLCLI